MWEVGNGSPLKKGFLGSVCGLILPFPFGSEPGHSQAQGAFLFAKKETESPRGKSLHSEMPTRAYTRGAGGHCVALVSQPSSNHQKVVHLCE